MGTPDIAASVLQSLIDNEYNIVGVISQMDKPVGRKGIIEKVPTKVVAEKYNIPVFQPQKIRLDYEFVKQINPDVIVTLAYGQIVPQGLLDIPRFGCINLHGSLLPKYRGAAPMQYAIINGEKETGMCLMEMIDRMDAGRVYATKKVNIDEEDTYATLKIKMTEAAKELILQTIMPYVNGNLPGVQQDDSLATFCPTIKKEEEHIDLSLPGFTICNWVRALNDQPGLYFILDDVKYKIWKAKLINNHISAQVGTIVEASKKGLIFQAIDGQIAIYNLQKEGKKAMDHISFINGNKNLVGKIIK